MAERLNHPASGGASVAAILAELFPPPIVIAAAGDAQTLAFVAGARETTYDLTMAANIVFTLDKTNMVAGSTATLILRQDATAGREPTLPTGVAGPSPTPGMAGGPM